MNIRVLRSPTDTRNPDVVELVRDAGESNLDWIHRVFERKLAPTGASWSLLVLVGGNDPLSFRLRVAQSHVRHDLSPSAWSHVLLLADLKADLAATPTVEVSLAPLAGFGPFGYAVPTNGIQSGQLAEYASAARFPNIALLSVPVPSADVVATLKGLEMQRSILDVPQLIIKWLTYGWGVGVPASPLADGSGMPGAAVLEAAFAARGFDLTPGLESRSSCPEAIWQAATWWHAYYTKVANRAMKGAYSAKHDLVPDKLYQESPAEESPSPARTQPQSPTRKRAPSGRPARKRRS
jgi:hypothetical protein